MRVFVGYARKLSTRNPDKSWHDWPCIIQSRQIDFDVILFDLSFPLCMLHLFIYSLISTSILYRLLRQ